MFLSILPTNVIDPFLNSNIPQLVILGILLGAALLLLGDKVKGIKDLLMQINQWVRCVMKILLVVIPIIPFWIPMCAAMMSIKTTVYLIFATLMVAEISGMALTTAFMFTMLFVTMELSLASPGAACSWAIMFEILGLSTDYVGIFSIYRVATENFSTASTMAYSMLEQVEAAYRLGGMKEGQVMKERHRPSGKKKRIRE